MPISPQRIIIAPAEELHDLLKAGDLTSETIIKAFLSQIQRHNQDGLKLNALISVCPEKIALEQAKRLDRERKEGKIRSVLHGLPIVVKV